MQWYDALKLHVVQRMEPNLFKIIKVLGEGASAKVILAEMLSDPNSNIPSS
jgi:hypothetical protein